MKKFFFKVHLWLSIPLGIIITIICLTGAILVFRTEIEESAHPELYYVQEKTGKQLPLSELIPRVEAQLGEIRVTGISVDSDPSRNYSLSTNEGHRTAVYVNPYTGDIVGKSLSDGFFSQMLQLHRWLLIDRQIGKPIVGYTTFLLVFILISGIVICFPKNRKQLKRICTIHLTKGWKRFWYDLHVSGGTYVLVGLLILSLTGLTWSFQWYREPFYKLFGAEAPRGGGNPQAQAARPFSGEAREQGRGRGDANGTSSSDRILKTENRPDSSPDSTAVKTPESEPGANPDKRGSGRPERKGNIEGASRSNRERAMASGRNHPERESKSVVGSSEYGHWEGRRGNRPEGRRDSLSTGRRERGGRPQPHDAEVLNIRYWDQVLARIQGENPNYKRITLRNNAATVSQNKLFGNSRGSDRYSFDGNTGEITEHVLYKDTERSAKVRGWIYSIHVGSWGGLFSKVITCLVSLLGATLPATGYYLWIKRLKRKKKNRTSKA